MNNNFDADPEVNNEVVDTPPAVDVPAENPLFNSELANKTIDDVMAENKAADTGNDSDDFWLPSEDTPMDLNSLPDIETEKKEDDTNFFGDSNNVIPNLDFPTLGGNDDNKEAVE